MRKTLIKAIFKDFVIDSETAEKLCRVFEKINRNNKGDNSTLITVETAENRETVKTNILNESVITVSTVEFAICLNDFLEVFKSYDIDLYLETLKNLVSADIKEVNCYIKTELIISAIRSELFCSVVNLSKNFDYCINDLEIVTSLFNTLDFEYINTELVELLADFYIWEFVVENKAEYCKNLNMIKYIIE